MTEARIATNDTPFPSSRTGPRSSPSSRRIDRRRGSLAVSQRVPPSTVRARITPRRLLRPIGKRQTDFVIAELAAGDARKYIRSIRSDLSRDKCAMRHVRANRTEFRRETVARGPNDFSVLTKLILAATRPPFAGGHFFRPFFPPPSERRHYSSTERKKTSHGRQAKFIGPRRTCSFSAQ